MVNEIEIYSKDFIRLNIYNDLIEKAIALKLKLDSNNNAESYIDQLHSETKSVTVYGRFNISEDRIAGTVTFRPVMIDCGLKVRVDCLKPSTDRVLTVIRSGSKIPEASFKISEELRGFEFIPQGKEKYILRLSYIDKSDAHTNNPISNNDRATVITPHIDEVTTPESVKESHIAESEIESIVSEAGIGPTNHIDDRFASFEVMSNVVQNDYINIEEPKISTHPSNIEDATFDGNVSDRYNELNSIKTEREKENFNLSNDISSLERTIAELEKRQSELVEKQRKLKERSEKIEEELNKDYAVYEEQVSIITSQIGADEEIVSYYTNNDITPLEVLFTEIHNKLEEAENQIKAFIEIKQKKTQDIEKELKVGKK